MSVTLAQMMRAETLAQQNYNKLLEAVRHGDEQIFYDCLQQEKKPLSIDAASRLCRAAICSECSLAVFQTIVAYSSALLEELVDYGAGLRTWGGDYMGGLVQQAAAWGRADILRYLLEQGCSPNARGKIGSALEGALEKGSVDCVTLLEQREDVEFTVTKRILEIWGKAGQDPERDACFRIAAGRLLGEKPDTQYREIPILPGMTVCHAAECRNWPLVHRLCRETAVTAAQGKEVLHRYVDFAEHLDFAACGRLLDALFSACPGLLRCEYPRFILTVCMLRGNEETVSALKGWAERMPGRMVTLCGYRIPEPDFNLQKGLRRWEERMGDRLIPVLRRDARLPVRVFIISNVWAADCVDDMDECIRGFLRRCEVRGKPPVGEVSQLAKEILQLASPELVTELYEKGTLFPEEDLEALLAFCKLCKQGGQKRQAVLAYHQKEVDYEL